MVGDPLWRIKEAHGIKMKGPRISLNTVEFIEKVIVNISHGNHDKDIITSRPMKIAEAHTETTPAGKTIFQKLTHEYLSINTKVTFHNYVEKGLFIGK